MTTTKDAPADVIARVGRANILSTVNSLGLTKAELNAICYRAGIPTDSLYTDFTPIRMSVLQVIKFIASTVSFQRLFFLELVNVCERAHNHLLDSVNLRVDITDPQWGKDS